MVSVALRPNSRSKRLWSWFGLEPLLPLALLVLGQLEVLAYRAGGPRWSASPTLALIALALLFRRRSPVLTTGFVVAVTAIDSYVVQPPNSAALVVAWVVAFFGVGASAERRRAVAGAVLVVAASAIMAPQSHGNLADLIAATSVSAVLPYLTGLLWRRHINARVLSKETERLAAEREEIGRRAADEERTRLARELHDVVSHTVGTIVVQAGAGSVLLDRDVDAARESFQAIEQNAREAMVELRRLLGLLRDNQPAALRGPRPGVGELDQLADRIRAAGLPVEIAVEAVGVLPPAVDLSAYRIIQEALTNALKHSGATRVAVRVVRRNDVLEIDVRDDGTLGVELGTGSGLAGIHERVALLNGQLEVGPTPNGWRVHARLPLGEGS